MFYNSLQISGRKRMSAGFEILSSYTLSKNLTDNRGFFGSGTAQIQAEGAYWQNGNCRTCDRGRAFFDARHNFTLGGNWDVPVGKDRLWGKSLNRATDAVVGGWTLGFLASVHSGFPVTILTQDGTLQATRGNTRPNRIGSLPYTGQNVDNWFGVTNKALSDAGCFTPGFYSTACPYTQPAAGVFGNSAIGTESGADFRNIDFNVGKRFTVTERQSLQFRAEFFNLTNGVSFGAPTRTITSSTFGQITTQTTIPRNIQFSLKYNF